LLGFRPQQIAGQTAADVSSLQTSVSLTMNPFAYRQLCAIDSTFATTNIRLLLTIKKGFPFPVAVPGRQLLIPDPSKL